MNTKPRIEPEPAPPGEVPRPRLRPLLAGGGVLPLRAGLVAGERPSVSSDLTASRRDRWRMAAALIAAVALFLAIAAALIVF